MDRIWGRTGCSFDAIGKGKCITGDCNELLQCKNYSVSTNTVVRYELNQLNDLDFFDISLINGFNVLIKVTPDTGHCNRPVQCIKNINKHCSEKMRVLQGCSDPCTMFKTDKYYCGSEKWGPTGYSSFFKKKCRNTYTYPKDGQPFLSTCNAGTNYTAAFCLA